MRVDTESLLRIRGYVFAAVLVLLLLLFFLSR